MEIQINSQSYKGIKSDNMTHAVQEGTTSGNGSQRGQGDDQNPSHPSARLPRVCLGEHTVSDSCNILIYTC
jgi:hypothetical protein